MITVQFVTPLLLNLDELNGDLNSSTVNDSTILLRVVHTVELRDSSGGRPELVLEVEGDVRTANRWTGYP